MSREAGFEPATFRSELVVHSSATLVTLTRVFHLLDSSSIYGALPRSRTGLMGHLPLEGRRRGHILFSHFSFDCATKLLSYSLDINVLVDSYGHYLTNLETLCLRLGDV